MIKAGVVQGQRFDHCSPAGLPWLPEIAVMPSATWGRRDFILAAARHLRHGGPIRVLLVEDDTTIAEMYRVQLDYDGFTVTVVATGDAALSAIESAMPDIILLDLLLPDRSGLEVMVEINESFPDHPPVVILSNYGEPTMIERGTSLGAVEYLVKSRVTPDSVSRAIPGWIELGPGGEPQPQH